MLTVALEHLPLGPGARVLDVGCGRGRHAHALATRGVTAIAIDLDFDDVAATRNGFALFTPEGGSGAAQANAYRLPFPDHAFDVVVCSEVLEHLHDYQRAVSEMARVLKPGGVLAVSVPRGWPEAICWRLSQEYANTPGGHVRIFKAGALKTDIEREGFTQTRRYHRHGLHSPFWWLKCALWKRRDTHPIIRAYQRVLEWDILKRPWLTRSLDALANPIMGKSVVMHFRRAETTP